ncbi:MAG: hypothetical protein ACREEX_02075 [Caulobacteraceae bacterium]
MFYDTVEYYDICQFIPYWRLSDVSDDVDIRKRKQVDIDEGAQPTRSRSHVHDHGPARDARKQGLQMVSRLKLAAQQSPAGDKKLRSEACSLIGFALEIRVRRLGYRVQEFPALADAVKFSAAFVASALA